MPNINDMSKISRSKKIPLPLAIAITLMLVICVRESAFFICQALGYASAANIVGMITMFILLIIWRFTVGLPEWITQASNTLLVDSGFAFLPVSAGAGLLMFGLGDELLGVTVTLIISTLLPLWGLATLANIWLSRRPLSENIDEPNLNKQNNDSPHTTPSSSSDITKGDE